MRELRNTKIIAVDHGYDNMKTANTVTPTGIKAYETEPIFTGNILEYNGIYYRIGEGHKEFIPDKAMDEEYYLRFVGCSLYPQGYPAIVNQLGNFKGINLLADIENGTMNILYINNKKAQESRCWTEKLGVN